eukprot:956252-Pyramimonas_sp.AAC.1
MPPHPPPEAIRGTPYSGIPLIAFQQHPSGPVDARLCFRLRCGSWPMPVEGGTRSFASQCSSISRP